MPNQAIRNLVFQGGSVKGVAYIGALEALRASGIDLRKIKGVAGTSAGAITAGLLALGCTIEQVRGFMQQLDFKSFMDDKPGGISTRGKVLRSVGKQARGKGFFSSSVPVQPVKKVIKSRIQKDGGNFEGEYFRNWIDNIIKEQVSVLTGGVHNGENLTFSELHALTINYPDAGFCDLKLVGANTSAKVKETYSYETHPDTIISDAIRISMSIPGFFKSHQIYNKVDGVRCRMVSPDVRVDGGIYDNYPIDCFDDAAYVDHDVQLLEAADGKRYNPQTLGFRLVTEESKNYFDASRDDAGSTIPRPSETVTGIKGLITGVAEAGFALQEERYARRENIDRTVYINHLNVGIFDFNLADEQKMKLIQSGQEATSQYFDRHPSLLPEGIQQNNILLSDESDSEENSGLVQSSLEMQGQAFRSEASSSTQPSEKPYPDMSHFSLFIPYAEDEPLLTPGEETNAYGNNNLI